MKASALAERRGRSTPSTSFSSAETSHSSDLKSGILEEPEDDVETASENNEPITPIDLHTKSNENLTPKSLLQPPPTQSEDVTEQTSPLPNPTTPLRQRFSSIFRRSISQQVMPTAKLVEPQNGTSETNLTKRIMPSRRQSVANSTADSPFTTRSNTPPSPRASASNLPPVAFYKEPGMGDINRKNRSSTGFSQFRQKILGHHERESIDSGEVRKRSTSVDLNNIIVSTPGTPDQEITPPLGSRQPWAMPAQYGTGSKARRLSLSLPDDFNVDVIELHKEYSDQSKLIGKRGKTLGKGATSKVTLMVRKGGPSTELYAVKEFRGKSKLENEEEYMNKIKSEFSISKSLHHPNIVETFRLSTDHGRWNHVMEYCEQGDLFGLVKHGHLKAPDRLSDRLCLFKQLVQGVNYLHTHGIAHRDIKLENLLLTNQSKLKITDFGVSEVFSGIHPGVRAAGGQCGVAMKEEIRLCKPGICGSEPYIAPEVLEKAGDYDPRPLDVWSTAIVMLHLIFGGPIWTLAKLSPLQPNYTKLHRGWEKFNLQNTRLTESSYPYVDSFDSFIKPPALRRMLLGMLNPNPKDRLSIGEVVKKGWFKGIECCQLESWDEPAVEIDAGKKGGGVADGGVMKVVRHNHLPEKHGVGHGLFVRSPGRGDE